MIGSKFVRMLLSLLLCVSLVPTHAFALDAAEDELVSPNTQADAPDSTSAGKDSDKDGSAPGVSEPDPPASGIEPPLDSALPASFDEAALLQDNAAESSRAASAFTSTCFASISTSPNQIRAQAISGNQQAPKTYYAHAWKTTTSRIKDDGGFSFQWFACSDTKPGALTDADAIPGATQEAFELTEELGKELDGKHLFVRITSGSVALDGPRSANSYRGALSNTSTIKAPIPDKTAFDSHSYILIQASGDAVSHLDKVEAAPLSAGTTLHANAYDGEASPNRRIADQPSWQYQWLYSSEQEAPDSAFDPIEGATQKSLTITESLTTQLAGKYIRVKVTGDGHELYGPSSSLKTPASVTYNTPGPVKAKGQIVIDHVVLAFGDDDFGDNYESVPNANVGDTIRAAAYDSNLPNELYLDDKVNFEWQISSAASGPFSTVATGGSFTVGDYAGKFLRVVATAKNGVPGCDQHATEAGRILPKGAHILYSVSVLNASAVTQTRETLKALAYEGDYWDQVPVHDGVEYTWRWSATKPNYWGEADWHDIPGITGAIFTIPDEFAGLWVSVKAQAGDNVVEAEDYAGPFTKPTQSEGPSDPQGAPSKATVKVTGVTPHKPGEVFLDETWIPLSEFRWEKDVRVTAWDAFKALLDEAGYFYDTKGGFPYSITTSDGARTLAMSANAPWSYWAFYINGVYADTLACSYAMKPGDSIELRYVDTTGIRDSWPGAIQTYPQEETPEVQVEWKGFGASSSVAGATPTSDIMADWTFVPEVGASGATWSEPVLLNGKVYMVSGDRLCAIEQATGKLIASVALAASVNKGGCRPVYTAGKIVVPLADGRLQALSATTLHCIWVSDPLPQGTITHELALAALNYTTVRATELEGIDARRVVSYPSSHQSLSSLFVHDGYIYAGTAIADAEATYGGCLMCVDADTGALRWKRTNDASGYYWTGAAESNGYVLACGDDGELEAIPADSKTGNPVHRLSLSAGMRSTVVTEGDYAFCVTRDGVFHKIAVGKDGSLSEAGSVRFAATSTSTPTIANGVAYVGGALADGAGVLACIDLTTMACTTVVSADSRPLPGDVKSRPLVSRQQGATYVYFTCNHSDSAVYVLKAGSLAAQVVFRPDSGSADYCLSSLAADAHGRLYYVNDGGRLVALKAASAPNTAPSATREPSNSPSAASRVLGAQKPTGAFAGSFMESVLENGPLMEEAGLLAVTSLDQATAKLDSTEEVNSLVSAPPHDGAPADAFAGIGIGIAGLCAAAFLIFSGRRRLG